MSEGFSEIVKYLRAQVGDEELDVNGHVPTILLSQEDALLVIEVIEVQRQLLNVTHERETAMRDEVKKFLDAEALVDAWASERGGHLWTRNPKNNPHTNAMNAAWNEIARLAFTLYKPEERENHEWM